MRGDRTSTSRTSQLGTDIVWVTVLGVLALAYFFALIAFDTTFFYRVPTAATVNALQVYGTAALLLAQVVVVPMRHRRPTLGFAVVIVLMLAAMVLATDRNLVLNLTFFYAVWALVSARPMKVWLTALLVAAAADASVQAVMMTASLDRNALYVGSAILMRTVVSYLVAVPVGLLTRSLRRSAELAEQVAAATKREQAAQVAAAVATERTRMARELHDVTAYHLSGIVLQARAVRETIADDPVAARDLAGSLSDESVQTMHSLRQVIQVLRTDEPGTAPDPMTSLPTLLDRLRADNPSAQFTMAGDLGAVPPAACLACHRIVQEALTNARKHAPGSHVSADITRQGQLLDIEVRNSAPTEPVAPSSGRGYGLIGMHERVNLLDGELTADPTSDGGWLIRAIIPLDRDLSGGAGVPARPDPVLDRVGETAQAGGRS